MRSAAEGFWAPVLDDPCEINRGFPRPANAHGDRAQESKDALQAPAHFFVRIRVASVPRHPAFPNLLPEPFVAVELTGNQFPHNLIRFRFRIRSGAKEISMPLP